jgi:hypothetical protein
MNVTGKTALSVLQKAMFVAKWDAPNDNPNVMDVAANPHFAALYRNLIEELIRGEPAHPRAVSGWKRWRVIEDRPEQLERVRAWIRRTESWGDLTPDQRRDLVLVLLSPFVATADTLDELLEALQV